MEGPEAAGSVGICPQTCQHCGANRPHRNPAACRKAAGGGSRYGVTWRGRGRARGTLGPPRRARLQARPVDEGRVTEGGAGGAFRGFDRVEIPRWLGWTGLSRGAQLVGARLFAREARANRKGRRRRERAAARPWAFVERVHNGIGRVRRPLGWFAAMGGVSSRRQASNLLRELEGVQVQTPRGPKALVWRQHHTIRAASGKVQGKRLTLYVNLHVWFEILPCLAPPNGNAFPVYYPRPPKTGVVPGAFGTRGGVASTTSPCMSRAGASPPGAAPPAQDDGPVGAGAHDFWRSIEAELKRSRGED